jgi:peptidyl-tRNA hydrolase
VIDVTQQQQTKTSESNSPQKLSDAKIADCGISHVEPSSVTTSTTEPVLYHYVLVRKDLPFGTALAQTVHAAGESAQNVTVPPNTHAVVLAVPDEHTLLKYEAKLLRNGLEITAIREPDEPWNGQLMAIGIKPQPREKIKKLLSSLPLYK